jgi:flagellar hook-basal body complex protein FliE
MNDLLMGSGMSGVSGVGAVASQALSLENAGEQLEGGSPFAGLLHSMIEQTKELDDQASSSVTGLLNGQGVDVHQAMISVQKASMAFELALQVRNKAVGAYQQMMSMQF